MITSFSAARAMKENDETERWNSKWIFYSHGQYFYFKLIRWNATDSVFIFSYFSCRKEISWAVKYKLSVGSREMSQSAALNTNWYPDQDRRSSRVVDGPRWSISILAYVGFKMSVWRRGNSYNGLYCCCVRLWWFVNVIKQASSAELASLVTTIGTNSDQTFVISSTNGPRYVLPLTLIIISWE